MEDEIREDTGTLEPAPQIEYIGCMAQVQAVAPDGTRLTLVYHEGPRSTVVVELAKEGMVLSIPLPACEARNLANKMFHFNEGGHLPFRNPQEPAIGYSGAAEVSRTPRRGLGT